MATAVAVWSFRLEPGNTESFVPLGDLRITNVALGETLADENGRTSVKLVYIAPSAGDSDDEEDDDEDEDEDKPVSEEPVSTVLCSLTPGKIEQTMVDIILEGDQEYLFESIGKNVVYLTGNYIDQPNRDEPPFDDSDSDSDGEGYDLRDVSSDVEIDPDEMEVPSDEDDADRFEEVEDVPVAEAPKESKKRPRESDAADEAEPKLSKKEKKKQKKLKAENGEAIPTGEVKKADKKEEKKKPEGEAKKAKLETKVLDGGLKIADNKVGTGRAAKSGDRVSVRYVGKLQNGKIFDSNTKGKPFQFRLGKGEVIKGWDLGVAGMQAGGERLITVPPALGYGSKKQGDIPANSTLIFEVKVVQIS
ncbi:hypothetical protein BXZ70DRAFT_913926 [Cristinia sonorae]|uniref:FK506-binding protein n=1 Tax=Cristinia sonorae TaxID=1940300 RepID=A0A8K0XUU6_9AGAR|nr:hypothetical protein BXZ70DRAFT_913926 [Cristinia sonorae]